MEQEEAVRVPDAEAFGEQGDAGARGVEDRLIAWQIADVGVGEVAEDREMNVRIEVAERQHFEVLEQRSD